ncbi:hypothetical protein H6P81_015840 [Aristolochia fimbriata]|uniref:RRM domain-containing protein n=1 Tax=Aristolochia fimbriata TaxID=158543 RepID=A0AAV7E6L8_ARIFI|nr:hypothetical protein H6P81_015840 [Aristolochia fimbriata]
MELCNKSSIERIFGHFGELQHLEGSTLAKEDCGSAKGLVKTPLSKPMEGTKIIRVGTWKFPIIGTLMHRPPQLDKMKLSPKQSNSVQGSEGSLSNSVSHKGNSDEISLAGWNGNVQSSNSNAELDEPSTQSDRFPEIPLIEERIKCCRSQEKEDNQIDHPPYQPNTTSSPAPLLNAASKHTPSTPQHIPTTPNPFHLLENSLESNLDTCSTTLQVVGSSDTPMQHTPIYNTTTSCSHLSKEKLYPTSPILSRPNLPTTEANCRNFSTPKLSDTPHQHLLHIHHIIFKHHSRNHPRIDHRPMHHAASQILAA